MREPVLRPAIFDRPSPSGRAQIVRFSAAYGLWLLASTMGIGLLMLWHAALMLAFIYFRLDKWAFAAYNNAVVIIFALAWITLVIIAEDRLRRAAGRGWPALRVWLLRLAVAEAATAGAGFLLYWLMGG